MHKIKQSGFCHSAICIIGFISSVHAVGYNSAAVRYALVLIFKKSVLHLNFKCETFVKYWSYLHPLLSLENNTADLFFSEAMQKKQSNPYYSTAILALINGLVTQFFDIWGLTKIE